MLNDTYGAVLLLAGLDYESTTTPTFLRFTDTYYIKNFGPIEEVVAEPEIELFE